MHCAVRGWLHCNETKVTVRKCSLHPPWDMQSRTGRASIACIVLDAIQKKDSIAGMEYFGRVWTLAERMARYGRGEQLCQWLSLEVRRPGKYLGVLAAGVRGVEARPMRMCD